MASKHSLVRSDSLVVLIALTASFLGACTTHGLSPSSMAATPPSAELAAISVSDLDRSLRWYGAILRVEERLRSGNPGDDLQIVIASNGRFEVELVELRDSVPFDAPTDNPSSRHGVGKLTFRADDLAALRDRAKAIDATLVNDISFSRRTGACFYTLADPDGLWIQFNGACPAGFSR